jgi:hypothetical protein
MKLNKTIITVGLISLSLLFTLPLPTQAQNSKQNSKCTATLQSVKNKITRGKKVSIVNVSKDNIAQEYQSYPQNRPFSYTFALRGAATESFLSSGKLLRTLSRDIITNCTDISQVVFGPETSDHIETFGLISGNRIDAFKCVYPGSNQKLSWGYVICI